MNDTGDMKDVALYRIARAYSDLNGAKQNIASHRFNYLC